MIVYNITTKILPHIEEQWLQWQTHEHIPEIMATGLFDSFKKYRLLEQDDTEGITLPYSILLPPGSDTSNMWIGLPLPCEKKR